MSSQPKVGWSSKVTRADSHLTPRIARRAMHEARLDVITREGEFTGPLTDDQRERLLWIANRCPRHRTLTSEIDNSNDAMLP
jgi:hypothetical protein